MPDTTPSLVRTQRAAVVYNPVKVDLDALRRVVAVEEEGAGWSETVWVATSEDDPGGGAARQALDAGVQLVIAAGGDGTVRAVAEVVAGSDASLGLLPAGTGNLLARNLDLTLDDLEHAIRTAFSGRDRDIDAGRIEVRHEDGSISKHLFLVMAGVGIDAKMLAGTDEGLKARIGWLAYVGALAKALRDSNRISMRYTVDRGAGARGARAHGHRRQLRHPHGERPAAARRGHRRRHLRRGLPATVRSARLDPGAPQGALGERRPPPHPWWRSLHDGRDRLAQLRPRPAADREALRHPRRSSWTATRSAAPPASGRPSNAAASVSASRPIRRRAAALRRTSS